MWRPSEFSYVLTTTQDQKIKAIFTWHSCKVFQIVGTYVKVKDLTAKK